MDDGFEITGDKDLVMSSNEQSKLNYKGINLGIIKLIFKQKMIENQVKKEAGQKMSLKMVALMLIKKEK